MVVPDRAAAMCVAYAMTVPPSSCASSSLRFAAPMRRQPASALWEVGRGHALAQVRQDG